MCRKLTYGFRLATLAIALLSVPVLGMAQGGTSKARERDSLVNLISQETDSKRLAGLYYDLALRYDALGQVQKAIEAADKAVSYSNDCKDNATLYKSHMLLGHCYVVQDDAVNALQRYLLARNVLEKKFNEERKKHADEQAEQGVPQNEIKELQRSAEDLETDADIMYEMGMVYFNRRHYSHSIDDFSDALITYQSIGADEKALNTEARLAVSYYMRGDNETAISYYESLLETYKGRNDWEASKMVYQRLNDLGIAEKDYDKVLAINKELYNECIAHNNLSESLNALNNIAYTYVCLHDYDKAAKYYKQLLDTDPKVSGDERLLGGTYTSLGLCYQNMGDEDAAAEYLKKAIEYRTKYSQNLECSSVENILALIYLKNQDLHNAEFYAQAAVRDAEKCGDTEAMKSAYQTYNKVLQEKGEYQDALTYYQKFLSIRDSAQLEATLDERRMAEDLRNLTEAENRYQEGIAAQEIIELDNERYRLLAQAREAELKRLTDLQEMERQRMQDLARQQEEELKNQLRMAELEREKLAREAELANKQKELADQEAKAQADAQEMERLRLEQEIQNRQLADQMKDASMMRRMLLFSVLGILGALAFVVIVRRKNSKLKEQQAEIESKNKDLQMKNDEILSINQEITKQKAVIEEANKSITDSIIYAKRIQTAVSPAPTFLSQFNFDYFLFFRPRDIVSGDYYWFYDDHDNHIFIVAADCTGHGVPGAFMSMLGVSLFNKIVAERKIVRPDLILNDMRNEVKSALHQEAINNTQKDGMDLSLVRIDLDTMMLHFAAANNNGYLFQEFDESQRDEISKDLVKPEYLRDLGNGKLLKLTIMPADAMPIGVYLREKESFSMTSYQLRPGDTFYLTSDGYVDQFGGKYGRKFLSRNFIKMLMDIHGKSMKEQEEIVIETHENWRGLEYDQLDDIIVMGIQV